MKREKSNIEVLTEKTKEKYLEILLEEDVETLLTIYGANEKGKGGYTKLSQVVDALETVNKIEGDVKKTKEEKARFIANAVLNVSSGITTVLMILGILFTERDGSVTTKALPFIPKVFAKSKF